MTTEPLAGLAGTPVLVTGGAGFIGSHLVDALLERGAQVRVLDDFSHGRRQNLAHCLERIELVEGDIRDLDLCRRVCEGRGLVFHEAALGSVTRSLDDPSTSIAVNLLGSTHVFTAAQEAGVRRVVFASSSNVYGDQTELPWVEGRESVALSPYAASKQMTEAAAQIFHRSFSQDLVGLRYFNVFGPRQDPHSPYAAVIPLIFEACLKDRSPLIHGDGEQSRDFTYIANAVQANLAAAAAPPGAAGLCFNVATGTRTTVNALAQAIRELVKRGREPVHEAPRPGDIRHSQADLTRSRKLLGYAPEVELREGLIRSLSYYQAMFAGVDAQAAR